ncbi:hypothetical protein DS2_10843 [Catenovulum agarivorans DS-2]|uniref:Uncharacterized protein n=1 Tax=Catenovulum agarivorans DS-2 TaxID=1328313 RepID=W7QPF7_9ALTE|nr:hypothetical protein [Catenovulum agarivorans]EWH09778.1 hypothetical protein DS2_10843 [Catenovulum agarivorans DS-2]
MLNNNHYKGLKTSALLRVLCVGFLLLVSGKVWADNTDKLSLLKAHNQAFNALDELVRDPFIKKGPYGKRRMMVKNAGHGNLVQDPYGKWWVTAFDHEYVKQAGGKNRWNLWLVPIEFEISQSDVAVKVLDARFSPTAQDLQFVDKLAMEGKPTAWHNQSPWTLPEQLQKKQ